MYLMQEIPPLLAEVKHAPAPLNGQQTLSGSGQSAQSRDSVASAAKEQTEDEIRSSLRLSVRQDVERSVFPMMPGYRCLQGRSSSSVLSKDLLGENQKRHRQSMCEYVADAVILLPRLNEAYSMHEKYHISGGSQRLIVVSTMQHGDVHDD